MSFPAGVHLIGFAGALASETVASFAPLIRSGLVLAGADAFSDFLKIEVPKLQHVYAPRQTGTVG